MTQQGFIFIPDISGFTKFVHSVELEHSKHIIRELLEIILNANQMGLNISEVEGDAILFYQLGDSPNLQVAYQQVENMFQSFHKQLERYENQRTCQCNACITAIDLSLKIITHYGEFTEYKIQNFLKLIGKDIIVAHRLLKNNILQDDYWLITNSLTAGKPPEQFAPGITWESGTQSVDALEINFYYAGLGHLKNK